MSYKVYIFDDAQKTCFHYFIRWLDAQKVSIFDESTIQSARELTFNVTMI